MSTMERVETLYRYRGRRIGEDLDGVFLPVLEHALQTALLAEEDDASDAMVVAAFLHEVGRLLPLPPDADAFDDVHELRAVSFLSEAFGAAVVEPVRLHVQALRYLVSKSRAYRKQLTTAAFRTLVLQGGSMTSIEASLFEELPHAADAVWLRLWVDRAKVPGRHTPPLEHVLVMVGRECREPVLTGTHG